MQFQTSATAQSLSRIAGINFPFRAMQSCQAPRILSPQDRITLLCGSRRALAFHLCASGQNLSSGVLHMSHPLLFCHLPFTTSTSSSSFTLPSATTQEHTAQQVQHDQLREHPVHHAHLPNPSVDKLRHQESLWRENLQSGLNPRTTTSTKVREKASLVRAEARARAKGRVTNTARKGRKGFHEMEGHEDKQETQTGQ